MADHKDFTAPGAWVAVDLDGTLAIHMGKDSWKGYDHIGEPIPAMITKVKTYLQHGITVKIFTARHAMHNTIVDAEGNAMSLEEIEGQRTKHPVSYIDAVTPIKAWCKEHIGQELEVTSVKDPGCVLILDDRALQVERNTGVISPDYNDFRRTIAECKAKLEMLAPEHRK